MRIAGLLVIAGCGASSSLSAATPTPSAHPCDPAHWTELAESRLRVWPRNASAPAHVVEVAGTNVEVASVTSSVFVTRWVPYASLSPIATAATPVSSSRGRAADPAVRILVGHRLEPPTRGWAAVVDPDGFVPARVAGTTWTEREPDPKETTFGIVPIVAVGAPAKTTPPMDNAPIDVPVGAYGARPLVRDPTTGAITTPIGPRDPAIVYRARSRKAYLRYAFGDVRASPDDRAALRTTMHAPTVVEVRAGAANDYLAITVVLPFAEIDGFWKAPPPKPWTTEEEAAAEMSFEVPAIHSPIAPGTCLYDAPGGRVVGIVRDADAFATPSPSKVAGWYAATIPTIWGPSTYYIDTPPLEPPPKAPADEWQWKESWTNEW